MCCRSDLKEKEYFQQQRQQSGFNQGDITLVSNALYHPVLKLMVLEAQNFKSGAEFIIQSNGLVGGSRKDGSVYFGNQAYEGKEIKKPVCDFLFPMEEKGIGKQHMVINYNLEKKIYQVKDLGDGTGTFIKIDTPITLKQGCIILFGNSHMSVAISKNFHIAFKFLDGPKIEEIYKFSNTQKNILIGRMSDCNIKFNDNSISRYQCMITYSQETHSWILSDGDGLRFSKNGT